MSLLLYTTSEVYTNSRIDSRSFVHKTAAAFLFVCKVNVQAFYCYSLTNGSMYSLMKSTLSITVGLKYDVTAITIFLSGLM